MCVRLDHKILKFCPPSKLFSAFSQLFVERELSDLLMVPQAQKVVWKFASMRHGAQCVTIAGQPMMLMWCVGNSDSSVKVHTSFIALSMHAFINYHHINRSNCLLQCKIRPGKWTYCIQQLGVHWKRG